MKKALVFVFLLAVAVSGGVFFAVRESGEALSAVKPAIGPAVQAVYATGTVEPTVMVPIAPRMGARLIELLADEGDEVTQGAVLARLEDKDLQKSVAQFESELSLARSEYARKSSLSKSGAISKQSLDQARTAVETAEAVLEKARAELDFFKLIAPKDGRIIRRDGETGEFIPAGQPVFFMECCAPLRISAEVDEEDIPLVQTGQEVVISADAFPGKTFKGSVASITPKGDPVSRSYRVRIAIEGQTPLMTGMTAESNIIIRRDEKALIVPASAINERRAWIVEDGKARSRNVETGAETPSSVQILSGLHETDLVLRNPPNDLKDGQAVRIRTEEWTLQP